LRFKGDIYEGVRALKDDCRIIVDVHMVKAGLRRDSIAAVDFASNDGGTKTASGLRNIRDLVEGSIVAIGNSPSAAMLCTRLLRDIRRDSLWPHPLVL